MLEGHRLDEGEEGAAGSIAAPRRQVREGAAQQGVEPGCRPAVREQARLFVVPVLLRAGWGPGGRHRLQSGGEQQTGLV